MKTRYINMKTGRDIETIDEFPVNTREERKELKRCLTEYRLAMPQAQIYTSQRPCKHWNP